MGSDARAGAAGADAGRVHAGLQTGWWLEDAIPGAVLRHPSGRTLADGDHVWLTWVAQNASDLHGNADAAARTEWGQPIVLGALTISVVIGLAAPAAGPPETAGAGAMEGWRTIRLTANVLPGDTVYAESEIHAVAAAPGAPVGRVHRTIVGRNQRGEAIARIEEERTVARRPGG